MDWQQIVSLLVVGTTAILMARGSVRRRKRALAGCGGSCGCAGKTAGRIREGTTRI